jgi:hypothetical protein
MLCVRACVLACVLAFAVGVKVLGWFPVDKICTSYPSIKVPGYI